MWKLKLLAVATLFVCIFMAMPAQARAFDFFNNGSTGACQDASNSPVCEQNRNQGNKNPAVDKIKVATDIVALLAGALAVIMIIISGLQFITSGGIAGGQRAGDNTGGVKKARQTLTSSIIGLIIVGLSWSIVRFITDHLIK